MTKLVTLLTLCMICRLAVAESAIVPGCHLATVHAQLCQSGISAAIAQERQAANPSDATQALLQRSGCHQTGVAALSMPVEEIARGPVSMPEGSREVVSIRLDHADYWYVAANALTPQCGAMAKKKPAP